MRVDNRLRDRHAKTRFHSLFHASRKVRRAGARAPADTNARIGYSNQNVDARRTRGRASKWRGETKMSLRRGGPQLGDQSRHGLMPGSAEKNRPLEELGRSVQVPAGVTDGELKLFPQWDTLRATRASRRLSLLWRSRSHRQLG